MNKIAKILSFLSLTLVCLFCSSNHTFAIDSTYVIKSGDKLTIRVAEQETLSGAYTVYSDGVLEFPHIPDGIWAKGLTYGELAEKIKEKLEEDLFYHATVKVTPYRKSDVTQNSQSLKGGIVYVHGMVNRTGVVEIPKGEVLTASKVIIRCGGFKDFANRRGIKLIRKSPATGKTETIVLNMINIIHKGRLDEDVPVQDGDMIVVPEQFFNF
ncbi:MAG: polysaccharide biosynthesis/export family protein [Candidatus Omnitrophica bacterium]|nr:polysaccharide biosynthesis/export family protein [Candidatus Omnitrophota bacterium]